MKTLTKVLLAVTSAMVLASCNTLLPKERWEVRELNEPPEELFTEHATSDNSNPTVVSHHPFLPFIEAENAARTAPNDLAKIKAYIDAGINLSDEACAAWFKQYLRDDSQINQTQGFVNVVGDAALALGGLFDASSNAVGAGGIFLGGTNNAFEVYKQYNLIVEDALDSLEKGVREGRAEAADNLRANSVKYGFDQSQGALREYHNTCSRIRLIGYLRDSVELSQYKPEITDLSTQRSVMSASEDAYEAIFGEAGSFAGADLENLYFAMFGGDAVKGKITGDHAYIGEVMRTFEALTDDKRILDARTAVNRIGNLLKLGDKLKELRAQTAQLAAEEEAVKAEQARVEDLREKAQNLPEGMDVSKEILEAETRISSARDRIAELKRRRVELVTAEERPITLKATVKDR